MNKFEHFADHAPQDIRQALLDLTEYAKGELDGFNGCEGFGEPRLGEVNGVGYDGFIPYQLGGYDASLWIRFDTDPSYSITDGMREYANRLEEDCFKSFMREKGLEPDYNLLDGDSSDSLRDEYFEYEQEWFNDGALLQFECWLEGKPFDAIAPLGPVMMRLSVNYKDGPHFRSKYAEDMHCLSVSLEVLREAVKRWPDDWQARLWRQLLKSDADNNK